MNSTLNKIGFLIVILIGITSCQKDFLEEKPYDFIASENFFKTETDARAATIGVYEPLRGLSVPAINLADVTADVGDNYLYVTGPQIQEMQALNYNASHNDISGWYRGNYSIVNRANTALEKIPGITSMTDESKSVFLADLDSSVIEVIPGINFND